MMVIAIKWTARRFIVFQANDKQRLLNTFASASSSHSTSNTLSNTLLFLRRDLATDAV